MPSAGPVFYLAFETNALEPPLIRPHIGKPETGAGNVGEREGTFSPKIAAVRTFGKQEIPYIKVRNSPAAKSLLFANDSVRP